MKNWNVPEINELDIKLTASSGAPGTVEAPGYIGGSGWVSSTYDTAEYERISADCYISKKSSVES